MTIEEAQAYVDAGRLDFDYLNGRVMKINLEGDSFDPWGYDRDNGAGAAKVIIDELRRDGVVDGQMTSTIHEHGRMHAANQASEQIGGETHWVEGAPIPTVETGFDEHSDAVREKIQPYLKQSID